MTEEEFAHALLKGIDRERKTDAILTHPDTIEQLNRTKTSPWAAFLKKMNTHFSEEEITAFRNHTHQTRVNTVATMLGIFAGVSYIESKEPVEFEIKVNGKILEPIFFDEFMAGTQDWDEKDQWAKH